jgi:heavy metal sensor kinase
MRLLPTSITGRLIVRLRLGAALILVTAGIFLFNEVRDLVISSVDNTLHSKRQMVTGLLCEKDGRIELELSNIIAGEYAIPRSGHYYRVMMDDRVLATSPSLVTEAFVFVPAGPVSAGRLPGETLYTSTGPDDEPVRILNYQYSAYGKTFDITLAESLVDSFEILDAFRRYLLISIPAIIVVLCLIAWQSARTSLRPLSSFSRMIERITHKNLTGRIDLKTTVRELANIAESFNAMLDRLNRVFESQKRFAADASHELKTPVSVARTLCDVALQRPRTAKEYADSLREIQSSLQSTTKLINDLLSLSRLDAGLISSKELTPVSLKDCIINAIELTKVIAAEKRVKVTVETDEELFVGGSRTALNEAFLNLLENAVRYNRDQGSVSISGRKANGKVIVVVSDTGIGIQRNDVDRIFERFYRADTVRNIAGTGLGLSIVKSVVEFHSGEIAVESEPGKGSSFETTFPAVEP